MSGNTHKYKLASGDIQKSHSYRCGKHCGTRLCNNRSGINEDKLESWLIDNFFNELNDYVVKVESVEDNRKEVATDKKKIEKLNNKKERLNDLYLDGRISKDKYNTEYNTIIDELKKLEDNNKKDKHVNIDKYKKALNNINALDLYKKLDIPHKRLFWLEYIDYIEQDGDNYKIFFKE